jgi:protein phosphatase PTC7
LAGLFDKDPVHPLDVMVDAFEMTLCDKVLGSCCVCIAHIDPQRMQLSYSNLGDCGLMVVRHVDSEKAGGLR